MNQIEFLVGRNVSRIHNSMKLEAHCRQSRKLKKESMKITRGVARGVEGHTGHSTWKKAVSVFGKERED